ncbi:MAG: patatin-like phospholipase family protein [Nitrospirota bacterium]
MAALPLKAKGASGEPVTLMLLGSGVRFPAYIGGLVALEEKGIRIGKIIGASAGSIISSLYAAGKTPLEMKKIALEVDITRLLDRSLAGIIRGKGLYRGDRLEQWFDEALEGARFGDITRVPLFIAATDILNNTPFIFSRYNFPDLKISRAIRFSIGIPWFFAYRPFEHNGRRHVFIDGNFMINRIEDMFADDGRFLVLRALSRNAGAPAAEPLTFARYFQKIFTMMMNAVDNERVSAERWNSTIIIVCNDIQLTKFDITTDEKQYLFEEGYRQVRKYLEYKWGV